MLLLEERGEPDGEPRRVFQEQRDVGRVSALDARDDSAEPGPVARVGEDLPQLVGA
jgi:hypothetical protein